MVSTHYYCGQATLTNTVNGARDKRNVPGISFVHPNTIGVLKENIVLSLNYSS